jgi:Fic family protein
MTDVRKTYKERLTQEKLFAWHSMLLQGRDDITVGGWRTHDDPMQIVSGAVDRRRVHFEAPPSNRIPKEMEGFIAWYNESAPGGVNEIKRSPVRAAIAHLYFESIHPFEDGNGRIGRALAEIALSQGLGQPILLSLSKTIEADRNTYYEALEHASRSNDITGWMNYFVQTILQAQLESEQQIAFSLKKTKLFDRHKEELNERQDIVVRRMLDEGPKGFQGGMNARKYVSLTKTSKATATRDMQDLVAKGVFSLIGDAGGRSTAYQVNV